MKKTRLTVDRRTFIIIVIILAFSLPVIIFAFKKSFFPIIDSIKNIFNSASVSSGGTGLPNNLLNSGK